MSRACDLGPGDVWSYDPGSAPECRCGNVAVCPCGSCRKCAYRDGCHDICKTCGADDVELCSHGECSFCDCGDCQADLDMAERELENDRRERDDAALEAIGDAWRDERAVGGAL